MPNPARTTVLLSLNGRYARLTRGSKLRRYVCRRPAGKPACPLDTTGVHGKEGETTYPASAGAENPGGAALQALKDCKKSSTGPPNVRYRTSLTMTVLLFGSKLA